MAVGVAVLCEGEKQLTAGDVVGGKQDADGEFAVCPACGGELDEHQHAKDECADAPRGHKCVEFLRHDEQAVVFFGGLGEREIDVDAGEIKKPCEPCDDEEYVEQFEPKIHFQAALGEKGASIADCDRQPETVARLAGWWWFCASGTDIKQRGQPKGRKGCPRCFVFQAA